MILGTPAAKFAKVTLDQPDRTQATPSIQRGLGPPNRKQCMECKVPATKKRPIDQKAADEHEVPHESEAVRRVDQSVVDEHEGVDRLHHAEERPDAAELVPYLPVVITPTCQEREKRTLRREHSEGARDTDNRSVAHQSTAEHQQGLILSRSEQLAPQHRAGICNAVA
eukprot:CAMPEP_0198240756 /NCGR_PEP_ID=MMETSP1446-20131203/5768_1 /TAXON_ID=1461542 ORGANISM="Unidentified sp, Strain CCMP2111" /NCGR_SAMPLE_ID=MMETSP1446 /ASSEMBLY_ACC=CAM_ASM_001112 /LENGTH=167 /DNA_ID=CAMNT_0043923507 /DNA_START=56 /DNA_END=560 /DNA_ORIENTATION=-